jgi:LysR family transcriptional activator of nhaA
MSGVKRLNYHHLLYFYTVSKEGSVTAAAEALGVAQPTVSTQLQQFEQALGHPLFQRIGRGLELTVTGRIVQRYANDIFSIGDEMLDTLEGRPVSGRARLRVGVADVLPKIAVARVLEPLLVGEQAAHLICYEGKPVDLLAKLSVRELDLVLSDSPVGADQSIRAFNHLLGECSVTVFASQETSTAYRREFPQSLDGARFVLPTTNTVLRRMLDDWFARREIHPQVIAEIEDSALVKAFAQVTGALFAAPSLMADQVAALYGAVPVGEIQEIQARFYAISLERKVKHPVVRALLEASQKGIFS